MPKEIHTKKQNKRKRTAEKRLLGYYKPFWKLLAAGLVCTIVIRGIDLLFAWLLGGIIDKALGHNQKLVNIIALSIIGIHIIKWFFTYAQTYVLSSATQKIAVRLRNDLYSHLQSLSLSYFEKTRVGHLMSRMTNDVNSIQNSTHSIIDIVSSPIAIIGGVITIFVLNPKLALVSIAVLPLMSYTLIAISKGLRKLTELMQIRLADVAAIVQETLSAVRIVKSFGMEDYEISRFADENKRTYSAAMRTVRRSAAMSPTLELLGVTGIAFVLWLGGSMVANKSFTVGELVTFLGILRSISDAAKVLGRMNITYHQTMASAQRLFDVLDEVPDVQDSPAAIELPPIYGYVEFRDVSFSYDGDMPVLDNISFKIEPGQQVALVGPSGSGKSTIANLVPRFYDVCRGSVLIDGIDVRSVTLNSLRRHIGIVPQESILFSTSIKENIAYGRMDAADNEIIEAAKAANAHEFIERLPEGYNTLVGERGTRLSGGQRQRVAIARALLKNPKLLILDEATSSLDVTSEAIVQDALERLMKGRTTLVIAHRLSTIVNADQILVLEQGHIVESGTHQALLARDGLYAELYSVQAKGSSPEPMSKGT